MLISPDAPAFLAIEEHVSYGLSPDIPKGSSNQVLHLVELWKEDQDGDHDGNNPINIYAAANLGKVSAVVRSIFHYFVFGFLGRKSSIRYGQANISIYFAHVPCTGTC